MFPIASIVSRLRHEVAQVVQRAVARIANPHPRAPAQRVPTGVRQYNRRAVGATLALRACAIALLAACRLHGAPQFLEDRFELPDGFRIYRAAGPELSGGSYDIAFDGDGRLLVGDGNAVRRLSDRDGDGVYDHFEVIATGLGWRGYLAALDALVGLLKEEAKS